MKLRTVITITVLMVALTLPVSAETVGDLQKEEIGIIVNHDHSQTKELFGLRDRMLLKRDNIQKFEQDILPSIQWNIPPDIMTMSASGRLEGNFILATGNVNGEFSSQAGGKSEKLYEGFDPYVSNKTTKELLFFAKNLLEKNKTYSAAEQVLKIQLNELENKGINDTGEMHIFYIQKIYNSVADIKNELDGSIGSINNKLQAEQLYEEKRNFEKLSLFEKFMRLPGGALLLFFLIAIGSLAFLEFMDARSSKKSAEEETEKNKEN